MKHLILVSCPDQAAADKQLLSFAVFMGVSASAIIIDNSQAFSERLFEEFSPETYALAMNAATLTSMHKARSGENNLGRVLDKCSTQLLVFGCTGSLEQNLAIAALTEGLVSGAKLCPGRTVRFALPRQARSLSRQLAGLEFSASQQELTPVFELKVQSSLKAIMTADEVPMFIRMTRGGGEIFVSCTSPPDLQKTLNRKHGLEEHYSSLIPVLIFLRHCFGESCWHARESTARLIIDDPILSEKYGFLDYGKLRRSMQRGQYGVSIAFIPWNYWRTSSHVTRRLLGEDSKLSICIHGCDHTNREFEAQCKVLLDRKASLAMWRMESQQKRTGAPFEPVMVFPQGRFSKAAICALRERNYLAAVNTSPFPSNEDSDELTVADLLRPAVTRYRGFPIFQRRYPRRLFDIAFDIFMGKPALVVEHHEYFRDGCKDAEEFVARMCEIEPKLKWPTLTKQLSQCCLVKTSSSGSGEIQFFTRKFQLSDERGPRHFILSKEEPDPSIIQEVLVDGASVPFSFDKEFLKVELELTPGQVRNLEVIDREQPYAQARSFGVVHNTGVALRRGLSEFRDNTLVRHGGVFKVAKAIARGLRVTGDARK